MLLGAELNAELEHQTARDTTTGPTTSPANAAPSRRTGLPPDAEQGKHSPALQCVVLVGGPGTGVGVLAADVPKPMLPVAGRPFCPGCCRRSAGSASTTSSCSTGHLSDVVEAALPGLLASLPRPLRVRISREPVRAGTGGALHHAAALLDPRFLLVNGDSWFDCVLGPSLAAMPAGALGTLMLRQVADASRYGVATLGEGGRLEAFRACPEPGLAVYTPWTWWMPGYTCSSGR